MTAATPGDLAAWVRASRRQQGLPETIEDPLVLHQLARLVLTANGNGALEERRPDPIRLTVAAPVEERRRG